MTKKIANQKNSRLRNVYTYAISMCIVAFIKQTANAAQDTIVVFNNTLPSKNMTYKYTDITATDSLSLNIEGFKIVEYSCSMACSVDWEIKKESHLFDQEIKLLIKNCIWKETDKLFLWGIKAVNETGETIIINSQVITIEK